MPKQSIPVRQDISTVVGAQRQSGQLDLGNAVSSLPEVPVFNGTAVVVQLRNLNDQAERVLAGANRAEITDEKSASVSTDFLASITKRIAEVDEERKGVTGKFDKLVKGLNALFTTGPTAKLAEAKGIMQGKLQAYLAAERVKAEAAARAESERIAAEAAAQAQNALDDGDEAEALDILESAANIEIKVEKTVVRGKGGATLAPTKRKVGKVTNMRAFLAWLAENKSPMALAAMGGVTVGQRELNQLAAGLIALRTGTGDESHAIPGFEAGYDESINAR
jgi:hypothetical protein